MPRLALAALTAVAALVADTLGLPAAALFGGLLAGLGWALAGGPASDPPEWTSTAAQAVVGVAIGAFLQGSTLRAVGAHWLPVAGVTLGTLMLTLAGGAALAAFTRLDRATAAFGMIAGGATGIVAISRELGADERLVAFMQYLRLIVVVLSAPLVARAAGGSGGGAPAGHAGALAGIALTVGAGTAGIALGRLVRMPAAALLGPAALSGALTLGGITGDVQVPDAVQQIAFAVIGLAVGLRFTRATVRAAGRLVLPVLAAILGLVAGCAALGAALVPLAHVSLLDGYLATTPGGLNAVLPAAIASGANATFVLAVQTLRLLAMLFLAPPLARMLARARDH